MTDLYDELATAFRRAGVLGEIETDRALRAAMSTDNSIYQITPDLIFAPIDGMDIVRLLRVLAQPRFSEIALTARGGGTGTNGQSLNRGVILDLRRHMTRVVDINEEEGWADVQPGVVLDALNEVLRPKGWFFAPETSTSSRCTIGGMVSTDASGKGSRIYGKTSDNILGLEIAHAEGLISSLRPAPHWAQPMLDQARVAAYAGREAFIAATPRLNRRFTGYDLERACPETGGFEWWRLFLGAEGTLGPITSIRVKLRRIEPQKRLIVAGFATFRDALAAASPLLADDPTAVEVMDEWVQELASKAGILNRLPANLRPNGPVAYVFIEFNGHDPVEIEGRVKTCMARLTKLPGQIALHQARDLAEIRELWAIRSAGVGLLGKVEGDARPIAFVEDCVVPPENLPAFIDDFLAVLAKNGLGFGIYGHVDVGCLHIRPALNIDTSADRDRLVAVSDAIFALTRKHGGIFWGEHGKGMRGAYLPEWIGAPAYDALRQVKQAFDPGEKFNPGKLVSLKKPLMGIATTPFRRFNTHSDDPLDKAFRCNGNAQCLSYQAATPICPSFKATGDLRQSPKGRADALRAWHLARDAGQEQDITPDLLAALDGCLGCKACASTCPVQVDIPSMRSAFYAQHYRKARRPLPDRLVLMGERLSPKIQRFAPLLRPFWPLGRRIGARLLDAVDLPKSLARPLPRSVMVSAAELSGPLPENTILLVQDWFTALFDDALARDALVAFRALGYHPLIVPMHPAGKAALNMGAMAEFQEMAEKLMRLLRQAGASGRPLIGLDPAFVMMLRQDYPKAGFRPPRVDLPQEFLANEIRKSRPFPQIAQAFAPQIMSHCTEASALPQAGQLWVEVFQALGVSATAKASGCCGMAGLFGHQNRHQPVSRRLYNLSWRATVATDRPDAPVLASGFSCRCQAKRLGGQSLSHPLSLIAQALA